jgi:hypothetical protein
MKKEIRLLGIILIAGLISASCSKDDKPQDNIVGTWTTQSSNFTATVGNKTMTQYFTDVMGLTASDAQLYTNLFNVTMQQNFTGTIQIKSDNTYTSTLGGQSETGTWSLSSDGSKLTIDPSNDDPMVFDVVKLTSNELQLHLTQSGTQDLNNDNVPETITVDVNATFTK